MIWDVCERRPINKQLHASCYLGAIIAVMVSLHVSQSVTNNK